MNVFTQISFVIGKISTNSVTMLGTGFLVTKDGKIATSKHVIGDNDSNLVILMPKLKNINEYQDTTDLSCKPIKAIIDKIDPFRDVAILKADISFSGILPSLGGFDEVNVGDNIELFGFPHCVEGRNVLTYQKCEIGARILLDSSGIKSKSAVINNQTRPGQSGSIVFNSKTGNIVGMLIGAYIPSQSGISLGGINPRELHQTTHCISSEYIKEMIEGI